MAGRDVIVLNEDAFQLEVPQGTDHYNFPDDVVMQKTLTVMGVNLGPVDNGTATSITATSISDTGKTWAVNQYPNYVVQYLSGGTIVNSVILSNTADKLTLPVTALAPDVGTTYSIIQNTALGDMNTAVYDPTTIAEQLVGLTATQTLTNKTLTSPSITTPTGIVGGDIVNTPAGNIAATDIQAAINELDTEKSATWHTHTTADVTDIPAPVTTNYIRGNAAGDAYETRTPAQVQSDINAEPANANIQAHISSSSNPHAVTAAQVGAIRLTDQNNFTARQTWQFGANIASASTVTLGTDGNAFHLTGTTTISDFTAITGSGPFFIVTDGILTFTNATGVLETNTGADITSAAGDRFRLDQDSDGTTWLLTQLGAGGSSGGKLGQIVQTVDTTVKSTASTTMVTTGISATLPSLASTSSKVRIHAEFTVGRSVGGGHAAFTIHGNTGDLVPSGAAEMRRSITQSFNDLQTVSIDFLHSPASTASQTYTLYFSDPSASGTVYLNRRGGDTSGSNMTIITLEEILA